MEKNLELCELFQVRIFAIKAKSVSPVLTYIVFSCLGLMTGTFVHCIKHFFTVDAVGKFPKIHFFSLTILHFFLFSKVGLFSDQLKKWASTDFVCVNRRSVEISCRNFVYGFLKMAVFELVVIVIQLFTSNMKWRCVRIR